MQHEKHSKNTLIKWLKSKEHSKLIRNGTTTSFYGTTTSFLLTWLKEKKQGNKIILFIPGKQYKKVNKEIDRVNRTH